MPKRLPFVIPLGTLLAALAHAGCGSTATTMTSPSTVTRCSVAINGKGEVPAQGGTASLTVSAARECAWSASVEGQWLSIKAGASGQGDGAVEFAAASNPDPAVRRGAVVLNEQRVEVMQAAGECVFSLAESSASFSQDGGSGQVDVRASSGLCTWGAESDSSWITVRSGATGKGSTPVIFDVARGTGVSRTGTVKVAGHQLTVTQSAGCTFTVDPRAHTVPASGGTVTVNVSAAPACAWSAVSADPWITVGGDPSFSGSGSVTLTVGATNGGSRAGTVTVAGQPVAISQGAGCVFAISPGSASLEASGGSGRIAVTTGAGCAWTAASDAAWIQVTGPAAGAGSGEVMYHAGGTVAARSGTLRIAGRTFTLTQAGPAATACTFAIAPEQRAAEASGGTLTVNVTSPAGCAWGAASNVPWLSVAATGAANGNGAVQVTVTANGGAARVGTATIAGRTFTVHQGAQPAPECTFRVSPQDVKVRDEGRYVKVEVESASGCSWSAVSNASWIRVVWGAAGSGNGEVWLAVDENRREERSGTVTVAGRTVTVTQKED